MNLLDILRPDTASLDDLRKQLADAERAHNDAQTAVDRAERALESDSAIDALEAIKAKTSRRLRMSAHALAQGEMKAETARKNELQRKAGDLRTRYRALCKKGSGPLVDAAVKALNQLLKAQAEREALRSELISLGTELRGVLHELLGSEAATEESNALDRDLPSASLNLAISRFKEETKPPAENTPERRAFTAISDALYRATH